MRNAEKLITLCITSVLAFGTLRFACAQDPNVTSSDKNLQSAGLLAQPFTILDFFIHRLNEDAKQVARDSEERKPKYRRKQNPSFDDETLVVYDPSNNRIRVILRIWVDGIDDPWEKVCEERLNIFASFLHLPEKSMTPQVKRNFGERYLGHLVYNHRAESVESIDNIVDAIVFQVGFWVFQNDKVKYLRTCYKDNANGKYKFYVDQ